MQTKIFRLYNTYYIHLKYLAKIDIVAYFSTLGGLLSMWMGYAVLNLLNLIGDKITIFSNSLLKKLIWQNIFRASCFIIMIFQLHHTIQQFITSNSKIEVGLESELTFPAIRLSYITYPDYRRIFKLTPGFESLIKDIIVSKGLLDENSAMSMSFDEMSRLPSTTFDRIKKILSYLLYYDSIVKLNKSLSTFLYAINMDKPIILCKMIFKKFNLDCELIFKVGLSNNLFVHSTYIFLNETKYNLDQTPKKDDFKKIQIQLENRPFHQSHTIHFEKSPYIGKTSESLNMQTYLLFGKVNNFVVETYTTTMMIHSSGKPCVNWPMGLFYFDHEAQCHGDCLVELINLKYGCLPPMPTWSFTYAINLAEFENKHHHKFCKEGPVESIDDISIITTICNNRCRLLASCQLPFYHANYYASGELDKDKTEINIIPKNNHQMDYVEKQRFSLNDLFYDCGGIVGMWLGWSVVSISNIFKFINSFRKFIISITIDVVKHCTIFIFSIIMFVRKICSKLHMLKIFDFILNKIISYYYLILSQFVALLAKTILFIKFMLIKSSAIMIRLSKFLFYSIFLFLIFTIIKIILNIISITIKYFKYSVVLARNLWHIIKYLPRHCIDLTIVLKNYF